MKKHIIIIILFLSFGYASGEGLTQNEKDLIRRVKQVFEEAEIEDKALSSGPYKCATPIMMETRFKFESLSPQAQVILKNYLKQPASDFIYRTPEGNFAIHYDTAGVDSVYKPHADIIYKDGVPDYVNRCGWILEEVRTFQIDTLGYQPPPLGGDKRYHVYLKSMNYLGLTYPSDFIDYPSCKSYIVLKSSYQSTSYPDQYDLMRIAAAHEFFHAIQFGYDCTEMTIGGENNPYWFEISSVWMEDVAYDYVNDYLDFLPYFFLYPHYSLEAFSSDFPDMRAYHPYASSIWAFYLSEKYGVDVIRKIWIKCGEEAGYNTIEATNSVLDSLGSSYDDAFREFTLWNFFTNSRADTVNFYSEGNLFDADSKINPVIGHNHHFSSQDSFCQSEVSHPPEYLGSNYIFFHPHTSPGGARLYFYGDSTAAWRVSLIGYRPSQPVYFSELILDSLQNGFSEVFDAHLYVNLVMVPAVISKSGGSWNFSYAGKWDPLLVGVEEEEEEQKNSGFDLTQNYPNPFNPTTTIHYTVHGSQFIVHNPIHTTFVVYNILGQKIRTLVNEVKLPGEYKVVWDGKDEKGNSLSSGVYFYRLEIGDRSEVKKMLLVR